MKTLKYILKAIPFPRNLKNKAKGNTENNTPFELMNTGFGLNFKITKGDAKGSNSLLSQLYSEENETLFI
jgi:hypothetical protein